MQLSTAQQSQNRVNAIAALDLSVAKSIALLHVLSTMDDPNIDGGAMDNSITSGLAAFAAETSTELLASFNGICDVVERNS